MIDSVQDEPARVAVVDDDAIVRDGLTALLPGFSPHHQVIGTYTHVEPLLRDQPDADVVVVDLDLQKAHRAALIGDLELELSLVGLSLADTGLVADPLAEDEGVADRPRVGVAAVRAVCQAGYTAIVYTSGDSRVVMANCLAAGASAVVHKVDSTESVSRAITAVRRGEIVLTPSMVGLVQLFDRRSLLPSMSPRQREVLEALAKGVPQKWIARDLGIDLRTVEYHWKTTKAKFAESLQGLSASELQRILGLGPVDLVTDARRPKRSWFKRRR